MLGDAVDELIAYLKAEIASREEWIDHLSLHGNGNSELFFYVGERSAFRDVLRRLTLVPADSPELTAANGSDDNTASG